jgi:hypothetical protein
LYVIWWKGKTGAEKESFLERAIAQSYVPKLPRRFERVQ